MTHSTTERPRPILDAIKKPGAWITILGTLITAGVSFGLLNAAQASALDNLAAALVTAVTAVTSALAQFGVLRKAEPRTTPLADPVATDGSRLVVMAPGRPPRPRPEGEPPVP